MKHIKAEILCVGTEILLGDIVNTNAAYLAAELAALGIEVYHQSVVGDNPGRLQESLVLAFSRADMVVMTGGLGPTYDDLTKETVAAYFGESMHIDECSRQRIADFFMAKGMEATPNNLKQAQMPEHAVIFQNDAGTAPGLALEKDGKTAILLPGPPFEMKTMFERYVRPWLAQRSDHVLVSRTLHLHGIGESAVEYRLKALMERSDNPTVAPYAKQGEVQLRITALAENREQGYQMIQPIVEEIQREMGEYIYGIDIGNQETALVKLLREKKAKIATAESCTGGLLSKRITDVAGASEVFEFGVCTYANGMKEKVLGVDHADLERLGAVSPEVAAQMAKGARVVSGAEIGIGITGIAGPGGGTPEKPVGLIYIAVDSDLYCEVEKYLPGHNGMSRDALRFAATQHALRLAIQAANLLKTERKA